MAQSTLKTHATAADVTAFIGAIENESRRTDAIALVDLFTATTGEPAVMWGPSIIGFGAYHYRYESGREGSMCRTGFSPRKANMVVYLVGGYEQPSVKEHMDALRAKLGKHKVGKSCLYLNRLADLDQMVLREMILFSWRYMDEKYPR